MQTKSTTFSKFMKEWGLFILFMTVLFLSRAFLWVPVKVDGHSMDPTLANGEYLFVVKPLPVNRFDIVVASEKDEDGKTKQIVKRVIGLPGDTIRYENTNESYLKNYLAKFKDDKLQKTYSYNSFFQSLADKAQAFTQDANGNTSFTIEVPKGEYLLLGDDRLVSKDSRQVGTFKASQLQGEAKFRFWPLNRIGTF